MLVYCVSLHPSRFLGLIFFLGSVKIGPKGISYSVHLPVLKESRRHLFWSCIEAAFPSAGESGLLLASFRLADIIDFRWVPGIIANEYSDIFG